MKKLLDLCKQFFKKIMRSKGLEQGIQRHKSKNFIFGIRMKLIVSFIVPIFFIVILGVLSYTSAAKGLKSNYVKASQSTIDMTAKYLDFGLESIESLALQYSLDSDISYYMSGLAKNSQAELLTKMSSVNTEFVSKVSLEKFINNIHMIPVAGTKVLSSTNLAVDGFYSELLKEKEQQLGNKNIQTFYLGTHEIVDTYLKTSADNYAFYLIRSLPGNKACIIIDVDKKEIDSILEGIDLGAFSKVALITSDGREIMKDRNEKNVIAKEVDDFHFNSQQFVIDSIQSEESQGSSYVEYNSKEYLYLYQKVGDTGCVMTAMIPKANIMKQAYAIRRITILIGVLSSVVAVLIGIFISNGISSAIHHIAKKLQQISEGDLTVDVSVKRKDEFAMIAYSLVQMRNNMRTLIEKASGINDLVARSAESVMKGSNTISTASIEISAAVDEINSGIGLQAQDSQNCLVQMDTLSHKIITVHDNIINIEKVTNDTKNMILKGINTVEELNQQTDATKNITKYVVQTVSELETKSHAIRTIIQAINEIAEQTNLLSLNASIEAARAGDMGKGFAVVAVEIRKLAEKSSESVGEIRKIVDEINNQTMDTVATVRKAEDIVDKQDSIVNETIRTFQNMNCDVEKLIDNLNLIGSNIVDMESDRISTLQAIESISAVSEETMASSNTVYDTIVSQSESIADLEEAAAKLYNNVTSLNAALNLFKI